VRRASEAFKKREPSGAWPRYPESCRTDEGVL